MAHRDEIECWLTDMDGVLVHENHPIPGAAELLQQWQDEGKPFPVLTNHSIFTARDLSARLAAAPEATRASSCDTTWSARRTEIWVLITPW